MTGINKSRVDADGNLKNGKITDHDKGGEFCSVGNYVDGSGAGPFRFCFVSGGLQATGRYKHDRLISLWKSYRENGELMQTGAFDDKEQKTGVRKRCFPNGTLMDEGRFCAGNKTRVWKQYDTSGKLAKTINQCPPKTEENAGG